MTSVEPRFFGPAERQLFGVYHPPAGRAAHPAGVLLCYPGPQEYMRCHWAFRKLATLLARAGLHVLRFDWYGSGDSDGDSLEGTPAQWRLDVATALQELRDVSGLRRASLVGFRLGAALALQASVKVRDLVLWEPVVSGRAHVEELRRQHELRFAHCLHPPPLPDELMGQPFPRALRREYEALDLLEAPPACRAQRVVVLASEERPEHARLLDALRSPGTFAEVAWRHVPEPAQPDGDDDFLLSTHAQQAIAALLTGEAARS